MLYTSIVVIVLVIMYVYIRYVMLLAIDCHTYLYILMWLAIIMYVICLYALCNELFIDSYIATYRSFSHAIMHVK